MKVVIFAGGMGTRLAEETGLRPKPMIEIGGRPILWHIMKIYSYYGFNDFVILTGYLSHVIKDYFINYYTRYSDITMDMSNNSVTLHEIRQEPWKVTMLYTGAHTMTGARLKKAQKYLKDDTFMLTYGDGVSNVDLHNLLSHHRHCGKTVTMTAVQPAGKFGALEIDDKGVIRTFREKPQGDGNWINGGFMVCEPNIFDYMPSDDENLIFEQAPLQSLAADNELAAYKHQGFWHSMDTLKDKNDLTEIWLSQKAPWAVWQKARR